MKRSKWLSGVKAKQPEFVPGKKYKCTKVWLRGSDEKWNMAVIAKHGDIILIKKKYKDDEYSLTTKYSKHAFVVTLDDLFEHVSYNHE